MAAVKNQVVMVTGGGGGLGAGVAAAFAAQGARVAVVDLTSERAESVAGKLTGGVKKHLPVGGDLSSEEGVEAVLKAILKRYKRVDTLIHTVGGFAAGKPVHQEKPDVLEKMLAMNVWPLYLVGGAVARQMVKQERGGSIVFILAKAGQKGGKNSAAYSASKAAATRIMESMAAELRDKDIRVNGISPSTIDTPANREAMPKADFSTWVTPRQIAEACLYLSDGDTGIYGANIDIFGTGG